jgi:hypothetical protein
MRRAMVFGWILFAGASIAQAQQFPPASPPSPAVSVPPTANPAARPAIPEPVPLATRQTTFTIPFNIAARGGVSEVQLHVSKDRGQTWAIASRQLPAAKHFVFRADSDGEFWFASQTIDAQGRSLSGDKLTPELRVRVDTTTPKTELSARVGASGEVIAEWQASDSDLVAEALTLEYQAAGDERWQSVVLDPAQTKRVGDNVTGVATWFPKTNHRAINLRIVARDGAGNVAVLNRGVYLPSARGKLPEGKSPAPLDVDPFRRDDLKVSDKPPQKWPAENEPVTAQAPPRVADAFGTFKPVAAPIEKPVATNADAASLERPPVRSFEPTAPSTDAPTSPPTTAIPAQNADAEANVGASHPNVPDGQQPSFTIKKRFKLDYDSDNIPVEDIAAVELWGTHDGGKSWLKWGADPDRQSPFEIEVEQEGAFGFRILLVHRNGMAGHVPRSGDSADIWVGVDATLPVAKFGSVAYGKGANSGQLQIQWTASDEWLASRPITLSYATDPQGPWSPIAAGLANTGQYFWRVEPSVPRRVYLRLEARDQAGNVADDRLPEVIELEGLIPQGRIRGIE